MGAIYQLEDRLRALVVDPNVPEEQRRVLQEFAAARPGLLPDEALTSEANADYFNYLNQNRALLEQFGVLNDRDRAALERGGKLAEMTGFVQQYEKDFEKNKAAEMAMARRAMGKDVAQGKKGIAGSENQAGFLFSGRRMRKQAELDSLAESGLQQQQALIDKEMGTQLGNLQRAERQARLGQQDADINFNEARNQTRQGADEYRQAVINQGLGYVGSAAGRVAGGSSGGGTTPTGNTIANGTAPNSMSIKPTAASPQASEQDPYRSALQKKIDWRG
jgi:hypothetical protein